MAATKEIRPTVRFTY